MYLRSSYIGIYIQDDTKSLQVYVGWDTCNYIFMNKSRAGPQEGGENKQAIKAAFGKREKNKAEKRESIRSAALKLFSELGYEATTLRAVAREAHVALGTLSLYAKDKRDLSLLVFNEHIAELTEQAAVNAGSKKKSTPEERLLAFFATYYRDFAQNHTLARIFLQLNYYSSGMHGADYQRAREQVSRAIMAIVDDARSTGEINYPESSELIARNFFIVFSAAVRWWIAEPAPDLNQGLNEISRLLHIQFTGLRGSTVAGPLKEPPKARQQ